MFDCCEVGKSEDELCIIPDTMLRAGDFENEEASRASCRNTMSNNGWSGNDATSRAWYDHDVEVW